WTTYADLWYVHDNKVKSFVDAVLSGEFKKLGFLTLEHFLKFLESPFCNMSYGLEAAPAERRKLIQRQREEFLERADKANTTRSKELLISVIRRQASMRKK
ncbi:MAG: hypothetical protein NZO58_13645, partial [Gemmataceae bacterium]|nr:hypothetical protein [Gemmataceae bacterium]